MRHKPGLQRVVEFIKTCLPDLDWVLAHMEARDGWLVLRPEIIRMLRYLNVGNYAQVYVDEARISALFVRAVEQTGELPELEKAVADALGAGGRGSALEKMMELFVQDNDEFEFPRTTAEVDAAKAAFEELSPEERTRQVRGAQYFWAFFLSFFYNSLALMVHGNKLTELVRRALNGSDSALVLAVQIDRTILVSIPECAERVRRAHFEGDRRFFAKLGYRLSNPVLRGKIKYRQLFLLFTLLEYFGYLDGTLKHREILDVADKVGLRRPKIADVETLTKQLRLYRQLQAGRSVSMQHE